VFLSGFFLFPSGFPWVSGFIRVPSRVFSGFEFFLVPFQVSVFLGVSGAPTGEKRNPHLNMILYGSGTGQPVGTKMNPNLHLSGLKLMGNPKPEPELPFLPGNSRPGKDGNCPAA
jgi:hypothetical protein